MLTAPGHKVLPRPGAARCRYMVRTALVALTAALMLTACGSAGASGGPSPDPCASPGYHPNCPTYAVVVTETDTVATIHVGQKLELVLHARSGMTNWSGVRSSDTSVLAPIVNPAATAVRGVTLAAFQAVAPGQAVITATAGAACSPGQACPMFAMLYSVTVTVT